MQSNSAFVALGIRDALNLGAVPQFFKGAPLASYPSNRPTRWALLTRQGKIERLSGQKVEKQEGRWEEQVDSA